MGYANQFKTVLLLGALTGLMLLVGGALGGAQGLTVALIFALAINLLTYWFSDKIVLAIYRAKEADPKVYHKLISMVRDVSNLADMPMPKVYVIESATPNAFATGRNPKKAAVAATTGIMQLLSDSELRGVMAHEISHIRNRDTLIATIAATIAGVISYIAFMARWAAIFGGFGKDDDRGGGILELIVLAIITPLIATIIQLAISRSREYLADESAARIIHNPAPLADALLKLEKGVKHDPFQAESKAGASLFIVNPFSAKGFINLFSTHPPIEERVKRLRGLSI